MKKFICIILVIIMTCYLCACGSNSVASKANMNKNKIQEVLNSQAAQGGSNPGESISTEKKSTEVGTEVSQPATFAETQEDTSVIPKGAKTVEVESDGNTDYKGVDVDLTTMSSTMVYSEVLNMMQNPSEYKDKIVKMKGPYSPYYDKATNTAYYNVIIKDATACCSSGIEFLLANGKYPTMAECPELCVVGKFKTYNEGNLMYCTLADAVIVEE